ncbi:MAG TPA: dihydrofolate reductase family protein [Clostridia bacterium]|nr:dihydrofolate reductase family protein [Clostridia bacterium]
MRKLIGQIHISLDGFAAVPSGDLSWIRVDEEIFDDTLTMTDRADAAIYGRKTYGIMEEYWPTAPGQPNASKHDKEHGAWYAAVDKYVISNTLHDAKSKTTIIRGDIAAQLSAIKAQPGKDILLFGSPSTAQTLLRMNLVDELCLLVNPILLGSGMPYFKDIGAQKRLRLIESRAFSAGVVKLVYQVLM